MKKKTEKRKKAALKMAAERMCTSPILSFDRSPAFVCPFRARGSLVIAPPEPL